LNTAAQAEAAQQLDEGKEFGVEDLSFHAQQKIETAKQGAGVCSRCNFASGCDKCDGDKAVVYWMKTERPFWLKKQAEEAAKKKG